MNSPCTSWRGWSNYTRHNFHHDMHRNFGPWSISPICTIKPITFNMKWYCPSDTDFWVNCSPVTLVWRRKIQENVKDWNLHQILQSGNKWQFRFNRFIHWWNTCSPNHNSCKIRKTIIIIVKAPSSPISQVGWSIGANFVSYNSLCQRSPLVYADNFHKVIAVVQVVERHNVNALSHLVANKAD